MEANLKTLALTLHPDQSKPQKDVTDVFPASKDDQLVSVYLKKNTTQIKIDFLKKVDNKLDYYWLLIQAGILIQNDKIKILLAHAAKSIQAHVHTSNLSQQIPPRYSKTFNLKELITSNLQPNSSGLTIYCAIKAFLFAAQSRCFQKTDLEDLRAIINTHTSKQNDGSKENPFKAENLFQAVQNQIILDPIGYEEPIKIISSQEDFKKWFNQNSMVINDYNAPPLLVAKIFYEMAEANNFNLLEVLKRLSKLNAGYSIGYGIVHYINKLMHTLWDNLHDLNPTSCLFGLNWYCNQDRNIQYELKQHCLYLLKTFTTAVQCIKLQAESFRSLLERMLEPEGYYQRGLRETYRDIMLFTLPTNLNSFLLTCEDENTKTESFVFLIDELLKDNSIRIKHFDLIINIMSICESSKIKRYNEQQACTQITRLLEANRYNQDDYRLIVQTISKRDEQMFEGVKMLIYQQIIDSLIKNTRDSAFFTSLFSCFSSGSQKNSDFFKSDLFQKAIQGLESPFITLGDRDNKFIQLLRTLNNMKKSDFQKNMVLLMKERLQKEVFDKIERKEIDLFLAEKLVSNSLLQSNLLEYRRLCDLKDYNFFNPIKESVKKLLDFKNNSPGFLSKFSNCEFLPKHFRDKQLETVKSKQNYISVLIPFVEISYSYPNISKVIDLESTSGLSKWLKTKIDLSQSQERNANPGNENRMSMKQMDELVGSQLSEISNYILAASEKLDEKTYDELNAILAGRIQNLAEISKLFIKADKQVQKNIELNMRLYRVKQSIKKTETILTSFHQFCKLLNPDLPAFDWDLSKLTTDQASGSISIDASHRQTFTEEKLAFLEQIEEDYSTLRSVINLHKLMEEFKLKTSQHFFSLEDAAELEDDAFKILLRESIELLINLRNVFSEYVKMKSMELLLRRLLAFGSFMNLGFGSLEFQSEKLISLSKIAVDTGNEYKSEIEHIMEGVIVKFVRQRRGAFSVFFDYMKNQKQTNMKLDELESLYAQLKWRENIGGAHHEPFKLQVEFLKIILENTKKSLEHLESMRSRGYINNLKALMTLEIKRLFGTSFSALVEFPSYQNPLSIKLEKIGDSPQSSAITNANSDIIRVREVLGSCLDYTKDEERILSSNKKARWIQMLKPIQREILCEYFVQLSTKRDPSEELKDEVVSIFRFWLECSNLEITNVEAWNADLQSVDVLPTTLAVLSKVKVEESESAKDEQIYEDERDFTKWRIKFSCYKSNKYLFLFQLLQHIQFTDLSTLYPKQFFFCNDSTPLLEISSYLKNAFMDSRRKPYFLMDVHLLSTSMQTSVQDVVYHELNLKRSQPNLNIYFIFDERNSSNLSDEFCKQERLFEQIEVPAHSDEEIHQSDDFHIFMSMLSLSVVYSNHAGLGKTHWIRRKVAESGGNLLEVCLFGESSNEALDRRIQILRDKLTKEQREPYTHLLIKLDMMDNMVKKFEIFDQIIFQLAFLKCIPHCGSYIFASKIDYIYVEVGNNYQSYILKNLPLINFCMQISEQFPDISHLINSLPNSEDYEFDGVMKLKVVVTFHCLELVFNGIIGHSIALEFEQWETIQKIVSTQDIEQAEIWVFNFMHSLDSLDGLEFATVIGRLEQRLIHFDSKNKQYATMDHLINFIEILFTQFMKIGLNPIMNPINYLDYIQNAHYLFLEIYNRIFTVSKDLIWSKTIKLREEATNNKKLLEVQLGKKSIEDGDLSQFKYVESSWDHNLQASFIFTTDSLRVFYRSLQLVSNNIKVFIQAVAGETLKDFRNLQADNQEILVEEIVKSLSFISDINSPYLQELNEIDKLPATSQKPKKETFLIDHIKNEIENFENKKGFNLNYDNYLKMMLIYQRVSLGIPVILMGATGCGKTYLLKFLSEKLLRETLLHMTLHAGTRESDIEDVMIEAIGIANNPERNRRRVWVFFDEFNTSPLQALIVEMVFSRRTNFSLQLDMLLQGNRIPDNIIFVMACNPFRLKKSLKGAGLINESINTMLSHRVYPIPERILSLIWDFGNLSDEVEKMYIASMVKKCKILINEYEAETLEKVAECISICHRFLRENEDNSSISLRDLDRFEAILTFHIEKRYQASGKARKLVDSLVSTIFLCYFMRIESETVRDQLNKLLFPPLSKIMELNKIVTTTAETTFIGIFELISTKFIQDVKSSGKMHRGVAINRAVRENLYAMMIAILSKVPLIICGKPGTSKTLSTQIIIEYLNSDMNGPRVEYVVFSGSQVTTSESILKVFENANKKAEAHKRSARGAIVVVLFDEMGLAEIGVNNPLKVLHPILEPKERTVAFIGISNWKLDLSKMSRAMYVARPDPGEADLLKCVDDIANSLKIDERLKKLKEVLAKKLAAVVKAYIKFINIEQRPLDSSQVGKQYHHPCFFGQRDFFHLLKFVDRYACFVMDSIKDRKLTEYDATKCIDEFIFNAIDRNFSGKNSYSEAKRVWLPSNQVYKSLFCEISKTDISKTQKLKFSVIEMINQNLIDAGSRHLMIFTQNQTVTELMNSELKQFFISKMKYKEEQIKIITKTIGSKDANEVVQALPGYIESGCVLILRDTDEIYSCLYEVLNQKYFALSEDSDELNCRLHFGDDKAPKVVKIHKSFRVIVLMDASEKTYKDTENRHPAPFLNRCEKYLVQENDLLNPEQVEVKSKLEAKLKEFAEEQCYLNFPPHTLIHNYSQELIYSLTIAEMTDIKAKDGFFQDEHTIHMNDYLNRLIGQFACEADSDMADAEVIKQEESEEMEEMNHEEFLEAALKRMYKLYSRNMIFFSFLCTQLNPFTELREIQESISTFNEKHKIQSFEQLLEHIDPSNQVVNKNKFAVFTLSQPTELDVILSRLGRKNLLECDDFLKFNVLRREEDLKSLVFRGSNLIIRFRGRKEWENIRLVRGILDEMKISAENRVILVAHYLYEDLRNFQEVQTSLSFLSEANGWELLTIDDLTGCDYDWFYEIIQLPLDKAVQCCFSQNEQDNPKTKGILNQMVLDTIDNLMENPRPNWALSYLKKDLRLIEVVREYVVGQVRQKLEQELESEQAPISVRIYQDDFYKGLLRKHPDSMFAVRSILQDTIKIHVNAILNFIDISIGFDDIKEANRYPQELKEVIIERWQIKIINLVHQANQDLANQSNIKFDEKGKKTKVNMSVLKFIFSEPEEAQAPKLADELGWEFLGLAEDEKSIEAFAVKSTKFESILSRLIEQAEANELVSRENLNNEMDVANKVITIKEELQKELSKISKSRNRQVLLDSMVFMYLKKDQTVSLQKVAVVYLILSSVYSIGLEQANENWIGLIGEDRTRSLLKNFEKNLTIDYNELVKYGLKLDKRGLTHVEDIESKLSELKSLIERLKTSLDGNSSIASIIEPYAIFALTLEITLKNRELAVSNLRSIKDAYQDCILPNGVIDLRVAKFVSRLFLEDADLRDKFKPDLISFSHLLSSTFRMVVSGASFKRDKEFAFSFVINYIKQVRMFRWKNRKVREDIFSLLSGDASVLLDSFNEEHQTILQVILSSMHLSYINKSKELISSEDTYANQEYASLQQQMVTVEAFKALEEQCHNLLQTSAPKLEDTKSALFEAARIQKSVQLIIDDCMDASEQMEEVQMTETNHRQLFIESLDSYFAMLHDAGKEDSLIYPFNRLVFMSKEVLEKAGFVKLLARRDRIIEKEIERTAQRQLALQDVNKCLAFLKSYMNTLSHLNVVILVSFELAGTIMRCFNDKHLEKDLNMLQVKDILDAENAEEDKLRFINSSVIDAFKKFQAVWSAEKIQAILKEHPYPNLMLSVKKRPMFETGELQDQSILQLGSINASLKDFIFDGKDGKVLASLLCELLEVNESMKHSLLEFCSIKVSLSEVDRCSFREATSLNDFMGFLEDDLEELLTLDDAKDKELVDLILNFLLSEKNLKKRVDFWYDHTLFRYADSEKKSLIQLADKCFGEKLSVRTSDQTIRLFEKLASRSITEQGIKKLERAFYILMNSEEKMPETNLKMPIATLSERLKALASEEVILKDVTVEELKDLLVFLGSAKFDHHQLSKATSFQDDNPITTEMVVCSASVICDKLSGMPERDSETISKNIRINGYRMKALLASQAAQESQIDTSDLNKPAFDLLFEVAFQTNQPQSAEASLASSWDIYRLVQLTIAYINLTNQP